MGGRRRTEHPLIEALEVAKEAYPPDYPVHPDTILVDAVDRLFEAWIDLLSLIFGPFLKWVLRM